MRRRNFLENSIAVMGGLCGIPGEMRSAASHPHVAAEVVERCSGSRHEALNALLDRGAMQRGRATTVDPDLSTCPPVGHRRVQGP